MHVASSVRLILLYFLGRVEVEEGGKNRCLMERERKRSWVASTARCFVRIFEGASVLFYLYLLFFSLAAATYSGAGMSTGRNKVTVACLSCVCIFFFCLSSVYVEIDRTFSGEHRGIRFGVTHNKL